MAVGDTMDSLTVQEFGKLSFNVKCDIAFSVANTVLKIIYHGILQYCGTFNRAIWVLLPQDPTHCPLPLPDITIARFIQACFLPLGFQLMPIQFGLSLILTMVAEAIDLHLAP